MFTEDTAAFFDLNGFADMHTVAGSSIACIIGEKQTIRSEQDRTWIDVFDVAVQHGDIVIPAQWDKITFDAKTYGVAAVHDDGAVVTLTLFYPAHAGTILNAVGWR